MPRDEVTLRAQVEIDDVLHILVLPEAFDALPVDERLDLFGGDVFDEVRVNGRGSHGVDGHPRLPDLPCQHAGELLNSCLGGGVNELALQIERHGHGGVVDDTPLLAAHHVFRHLTAHEEGPEKIGPHHLLRRGAGGEQHVVHRGDPGVVDEHIDALLLLVNLAYPCGDGFLIRHIEASVVVIGVGNATGAPAAPIHNISLLKVALRQVIPYPLTRSGDDDDAVHISVGNA